MLFKITHITMSCITCVREKLPEAVEHKDVSATPAYVSGAVKPVSAESFECSLLFVLTQLRECSLIFVRVQLREQLSECSLECILLVVLTQLLPSRYTR